MKIKQVMFHLPSFRVGGSQPRERFAEDGPIHVAMIGDGWVGIWDERDDEAVMVPRERVKEVRLSKDVLLGALAGTEASPEMPTAPQAAVLAPAPGAAAAKTAKAGR